MSRVVAYALGGGLGHITRTRAVLDALGATRETVAVLVSSPLALDPRVHGGLPVILAPAGLERDRQGLAGWVTSQVVELAPTRLLVDAFPAGVLGELSAVRLPAAISLAHTARLLRWDVYRQRIVGDVPRYQRIWVAEDLHPDHARDLEDLQRHRRLAPPAQLALPRVEPAPAIPGAPDLGWLVVHSGPPVEVMELAAYADRERRAFAPDAPLTVVAPGGALSLPAGAVHLDHAPARDLFARAERIVTAGGFNLMRETEPFRDRHEAVPLPRALDDQYTRVARARERGRSPAAA